MWGNGDQGTCLIHLYKKVVGYLTAKTDCWMLCMSVTTSNAQKFIEVFFSCFFFYSATDHHTLNCLIRYFYRFKISFSRILTLHQALHCPCSGEIKNSIGPLHSLFALYWMELEIGLLTDTGSKVMRDQAVELKSMLSWWLITVNFIYWLFDLLIIYFSSFLT